MNAHITQTKIQLIPTTDAEANLLQIFVTLSASGDSHMEILLETGDHPQAAVFRLGDNGTVSVVH